MTPIHVVGDIEVEGPEPGMHSMASFASVAVDADGIEIIEIGAFEAVLAPLPDAASNPDTIACLRGIPAAHAAAMETPGPPKR